MSTTSVTSVIAATTGDWALAEDVVRWIEIVAIVCIVAGLVSAIVTGGLATIRDGGERGFEMFKRHIARALLVGLDVLIAADIIRTVTLEPTLENVAALGLLVVVRTFLTWTLVVEAEGRWPWQPAPMPAAPAHPSTNDPVGGA
jgi:uncharacterized membrane protein